MKTYHDYSEKERAAMTEEQVKALIAVQMMVDGIEVPKAPTLEELEEVKVGEKQNVFSIQGRSKYGSPEHCGFCFDTLEQAQAFIALNPCKRDYDYETGSEYQYASRLCELSVATEQLYRQADVARVASILKQNKARAERNSRLTAAHVKACEASQRASDGIWSDWYECRRTEEAHKNVLATLNEYIRLAEGEVHTAYKFLGKRFSADAIEEAKQWLEDQFPVDPSMLPQIAEPA